MPLLLLFYSVACLTWSKLYLENYDTSSKKLWQKLISFDIINKKQASSLALQRRPHYLGFWRAVSLWLMRKSQGSDQHKDFYLSMIAPCLDLKNLFLDHKSPALANYQEHPESALLSSNLWQIRQDMESHLRALKPYKIGRNRPQTTIRDCDHLYLLEV